MRIVLTSHVFLPEYASGTEILTFNTAKELLSRGHEVVVCTALPTQADLSETERFDSYVHEGVRVHRYLHDSRPMRMRSTSPETEYNNPVFGRWFFHFLQQFAPDMVHFFHLGHLSASAIDVCGQLGIPMVMTPTDFWLVCPNNQLRLPDNSPCLGPDRDSVNCIKHAVANSQSAHVARVADHIPNRVVAFMVHRINQGAFSRSWFSPLVQALSRRADFLRERMNRLNRVIVPSRLMQERLVANGLNADKVVYRRFGIRPTQPVSRIPDAQGRMRVGFIGGLSEHKGAHVLIGAFRSLPPSLPLDLRIYGRTDLHAQYHERLLALAGDDPRIHFCGTFPNERIAEVFSALDLLVVPSVWYENTPLVIYSAQAAGCPVVATNLGGMSEVIEHGKNGLLFESGDVVALAHAIERLAQDRSFLDQLAANAIMPMSSSDYAQELLLIYDEVLAEKRERR